MVNYLFILAVCDVFVRSRRFENGFCQAGEADIQDYTHVQNVFTGIFVHPNYYYYHGAADGRTDGLLIRYRFRAIFHEFGEFRKCRCCVLMHNSSYKLYYMFGRNTDEIRKFIGS